MTTELEDRVALAHKIDPKLAKKAEQHASQAIGRTFSIRKGSDRVTGKITRCQFAGFARAGSRYKAYWEVTVAHENGGELSGTFDCLPRE